MRDYLAAWWYWRSIRPHPSQYPNRQMLFKYYYAMWLESKPRWRGV